MYNNHVKGSGCMDMANAIKKISEGIEKIYEEYGKGKYIIDRR